MSVNETKIYRVLPILIALLIFGSSCLTAQSAAKNADADLSPAQVAIAKAALSLVGRPNLKFDGRSYPWDCSGTVLAAMWLAGLDLSKEYAAGTGNGVTRLQQIATGHGISYDLPLPEVGDVIFWDNTFDSNENKLWDDQLTHAGIVVDVQENGTITYVHHDYRRGITVAYMNLIYPDDRILGSNRGLPSQEINSPMRMNKDRYLNPNKWLSSHLFRDFGRFNYLLAEASRLVAGK